MLSSDISATLPQVVPTTLSGFSGSLGVFSSDFEHCPVARDPSMLGLVYQALHHSEDAHRALAALLKRNFDDLIVVEPVTNWIVELLAKAGLAKRQEYSGVEPDWMSLRRISEIADREGYSMRYRLWWELPPFVTDSKTVRRWPVTGKLAFAITRAASWATSRFGLGSMAAIRLTKT